MIWTKNYKQITWAIRSTVNSSEEHQPGQLAFGKDMIFQSQIKIDWESIKSKKHKLAAYNNERENENRIEHEYHVGDKIFITIKKNDVKVKLDERTEGPY